MKNAYTAPFVELIRLDAADLLTVSDNDAPFLPPDGGMDDGWSGYH